MIGTITIYVLFFLSLASSVAYLISYKGKDNFKITGRYLFIAIFIGLIFVSAYFLTLIMLHEFQFTYIWNYTSKDLSFYLLISSFFAGQEGSFLLWALLFAILGVFLLPYSRKKGYESLAMFFYSLILVFLMLMLIVKSPFNFIWESFNDVAVGFLPQKGKGLNPILENFWMGIHPPILFIGYAAMSVPYIFAITGLIKKDFQEWINIALPWTIIASGFLGLGIGLGAFWAYETLGWGGFWGWDPVENSSLIPWIVSIALIHTMLVQKRTGGLVKTNFILAILSFVFVLYATFLTRSGILSEMSVHSFADPGQLVYVLLLSFITIFFVIGIGLLIFRRKFLSERKGDFSIISKESFVTVGSLLLLTSALIVFIGTSFPILLEIVGAPKTLVDISFYDKWNLPIAALLMIFSALTVATKWKHDDFAVIIKKSIIAVSISAIITFILYLNGMEEIKHIILAFSSILTSVVNLLYIAKNLLKEPKLLGSYISHAGVGLFFLGVIASGGYSTGKTVNMIENETIELYGYNFTFIGAERIEKEKSDREKYKCIVKIEKDGSFEFASPVVYWSDFNEKSRPFFEPGISEHLTMDIYLSPKSLSYRNLIPTITLNKFETYKPDSDTSFSFTLLGFDMSLGMAGGEKESFTLGAVLEFYSNGRKYIDTVYTKLNISSGKNEAIWYEVAEKDIKIGFSNFKVGQKDVSKSYAVFSISDKNEQNRRPKQVFTVEISIKPYMYFVWVGSVALILGFFIAIFRYTKKKD